jgi:hypothetical protein
MEKMEPGKWYLIAHCQSTECGEPWGFQEVPYALEKVRVPTITELTCFIADTRPFTITHKLHVAGHDVGFKRLQLPLRP